MEVFQEGKLIKEILTKQMPQQWLGRRCILEMKNADYHWKELEWIGWYYKFKAIDLLIQNSGGLDFTKSQEIYDYKNKYIWRFIAYPKKPGNKQTAIFNDCELVNICIEKHGGLGLVIAMGDATKDHDGGFWRWHTHLKGGFSKYENERKRRGRKPRIRKTSFYVTEYILVYLDSRKGVDRGLSEGWLRGDAQVGWRNSDGTPRNAKYKIIINEVPSDILIS